ncbi:hypothetical protein J6590_018834 [Homalodisca vitripennis]|nr:hypothetical protein J6590_018834 [Homalodisca vitripennis]
MLGLAENFSNYDGRPKTPKPQQEVRVQSVDSPLSGLSVKRRRGSAVGHVTIVLP